MTEILHIFLSMSGHYNDVISSSLDLSEASGEKTFQVLYIFFDLYCIVTR